MDRPRIVRQLFKDQARLIAYAWTIVRDEHLAEDLFADVAARAIEKCDEIENADHLAGWVRQAIRFAALDHMRTTNRRGVVVDVELLDLMEADWQEMDTLGSSELADALRHCLTKLTPNARRLVDLRYREGLSGVDVAKNTRPQCSQRLPGPVAHPQTTGDLHPRPAQRGGHKWLITNAWACWPTHSPSRSSACCVTSTMPCRRMSSAH